MKQMIENDGTGTRHQIKKKRATIMDCFNCKYVDSVYNGQITLLCCYGGIHFTPGLIYGEKPDWCPFENEDTNNCKWRKFSDGWFTYYINVATGEKKLNLEEGDIEVV